MMIQSGMHGRSINECRSNDCLSYECRSNDCRSNDCRSYECRSNDCRSNDCRSYECRSNDCRSNETTPQNRRKKQKLILMFKALEGELPNYITNNIISYINIEPNYMVRNPRFFTPPQCRTKSYKDSFFPTVLDLWNKLDNDTGNIQSLSSFKIKLNGRC